MLKIKEKQLSFYSVLYEKIPENHLLKRIDRAVDFSFINELLIVRTRLHHQVELDCE